MDPINPFSNCTRLILVVPFGGCATYVCVCIIIITFTMDDAEIPKNPPPCTFTMDNVYVRSPPSPPRIRSEKMQKSGGNAPTGCYKCGRPGHWSRDCPFSPAADPDSSKPASDFPKSNNSFPKFSKSAYSSTKSRDGAAGEKPKKQLPRTMPKLTPELLLSDDGLGFVLRHFPRSFKYHGRGHEVKLWILF